MASMANSDACVASLIFDYLSKKDASLGQIFQKKTNAVSAAFIFIRSYCSLYNLCI